MVNRVCNCDCKKHLRIGSCNHKRCRCSEEYKKNIKEIRGMINEFNENYLGDCDKLVYDKKKKKFILNSI